MLKNCPGANSSLTLILSCGFGPIEAPVIVKRRSVLGVPVPTPVDVARQPQGYNGLTHGEGAEWVQEDAGSGRLSETDELAPAAQAAGPATIWGLRAP